MFMTADAFIASMKAALTKAPHRTAQLLDTFQQHGLPRTLPPSPVITRWGTWLEAGHFHFQHIDAELAWIAAAENNSAAVDKLKRLRSKSEFREQLQKISSICPTITSTMKTMEKHGLPASDVWLHRKTVQGALEENFDPVPQKLNLYMTKKYPAKDFWREVQYFDPRKADQFVSVSIESIPPSLAVFCTEEVTQAELIKYREIRNSYKYDSTFCPFKFWKSYAREMPGLSAVALKALSIPPSSADVERSFSSYKRIVTPLRSSVTEENVAFHLQLAFNQRISTDAAEEDVEEDEDEEF